VKVLFTICGRAGSKGFKNKNLKEMNGVPLVYYTLSVIQLYVDKHPEDDITVALNTDSQPLIDIVQMQRYVKDVQIVARKPELAGDKVAKVDVIRDTFCELGAEYDVVVDLDITSPLRRLMDVESLLQEYSENPQYELVTSVVPARRSPYFNMVERKGDYYKKICESGFTTRQEAPASYELNASIYAYRPEFLKEKITDTILDHRCGVSVMEDYLVLDIDSEEDFQMMEGLHRFYVERDNDLKEVYENAKRFL